MTRRCSGTVLWVYGRGIRVGVFGVGAAYGTAKSGVGIASMGVMATR